MKNNEKNNSDMLFTRAEAAVYLKCSESHLANMACKNPDRLPYIHLGRRLVRYKKSDLDNYLVSHQRGKTKK
jgi:excisionase family DNA binding protein